MCTAKKHVIVLIIFSLAVLMFVLPAAAEKDIAGRTYYTMANIWYEKPNRIYSTNYHKGIIVPVGTKVTMKELSRDEIRFYDEKKLDYTIVFVKRHHPGMTIDEYFNLYFSESNPMGEGGPFLKFTESERKNIEDGVIGIGMSKAAVLMAYGYPPGTKTPSLKSDFWVFMENRFVTRAVKFKDDKVSDVRE